MYVYGCVCLSVFVCVCVCVCVCVVVCLDAALFLLGTYFHCSV